VTQKSAILIDEVISANNIEDRVIGLLKADKPYPLHIKTRWGIHTFGMRYAIDVVILDDNFAVQTIKTNLKPWRVFLWNPLFKHVLELPKGTVKSKHITTNSQLNLLQH
jgi:uncharacterized membrane protein (UPF0127 family)